MPLEDAEALVRVTKLKRNTCEFYLKSMLYTKLIPVGALLPFESWGGYKEQMLLQDKMY